MNKDKIIAVPKMEYYDDAKTQPSENLNFPSENLNFPKFKVSVHENGSLERLEHLNESGDWDGLLEYWYENGQKKSEANCVDDKLQGLGTNWHDNGQKSFEANYIDDKWHGLSTEWHKNGQKIYESNYVNGKHHGLYTEWHANGNKEIEGNYVDGNKHGEWKFFDEQGELTKTDIYDNGSIVKEPEEVQPAI